MMHIMLQIVQKNDLNDAYNAANSANCDTTLSTVYLDGRVLLPGV
jgi:hypothetical protein